MDGGESSEHPELALRIRRALRSLGLGFGLEGDAATLDLDGHTLSRHACWLPAATSPRLVERTAEDPSRTMYLADRITPSVARRIRDAGGWLADASGNTYVRAPGVRVDIRGRTPPSDHPHPGREANPHNLMSAGRAQVIFALLTWPQLLTSSMREIAQVAGVSAAAVHTTLNLLQQQDFVAARRFVRRGELIDLWAAAYPLGLARSAELVRLTGEPEPTAWVDRGHSVHVSGELAAPRIAGPDLVLYVPDLDPQAIALSRWRRPAPDEHANIVVRRTFWTDPDARRTAPGVQVAPPLLVYGDLLASNDPRQREIARSVRDDL